MDGRRTARRIGGIGAWAWIAVAAGMLAGMARADASAPTGPTPPGRLFRVLYVNSYHPGYSWSDQIHESIRATLTEAFGDAVDLNVEYLDAKRHGPALASSLGDRVLSLWAEKYARARPDLILVSDQDAYNLMRRARPALFPGVPMVFAGVEDLGEIEPLSTGVLPSTDVRANIDLILRVWPGVKRIWIITDNSAAGRGNRDRAEQEVQEFSGRVQVEFFDKDRQGIEPEEIIHQAQEMDRRDAIFFMDYYTSPSGKVEPLSFLRELTATSRAPVFSRVDFYLRYGVVGGYMNSSALQGRQMAEIGVQVLKGASIAQFASQKEVARPIFNYDKLREFGIPVSRLPEGSRVENRPESAWSVYRKYVAVAAAFMLIEGALIVWLIVLFRRQRRLRVEADEAAVRFRKLFQMAPLPMAYLTPEGDMVEVNRQFTDVTGYRVEDIPTSRDWLARAYPDPEYRAAASAAWEKAVANGALMAPQEFRVTARDGSVRSLEMVAGHLGEGMLLCALDVTERKRVADALQESEEKFRALAEHSADVIMRFDRQHRHLYVNPAAEAETGIPPKDFLGKTHQELGFPEPLVHLWEEAIDRVFATAEPHRIEFQLPNGDWKDWLLMPELSDKGSVTAVISSARDITARKRAEDALRENESVLRSLFSAALVGIALIKDRKYLKVNAGVCRITGYSEEELIGQSTRMMYLSQEDYEAADRDLYGQLERGGQAVREIAFRRKDGTTGTALISLSAFDPADSTAGACLTLVDITDRKKTEEALRRTQFAMDRASDSILWVDDQARIIYANDAACSSTGYSREELLRMTVHEIDPDFTPAHWAPHVEKIKREGSVRFESRHRTKDGRIFPVEVTGNYMEFDGRFYSCAFDRDLSERKRAEEERERLQAQLSQAHKMESVGRLAGGVAHDFNNMLSVILGHTELALGRLDPSDPLSAHLVEVRKAAERSADLTRQLLAFARKQTVIPKVLDLNETVAGMLKMLRRLIGEDIELVWLPGEDLGPVRMDPSQIDQMLANLCVNARDAIRDTGKIIIETSAVVCDEAWCADHPGLIPGEYVRLAVSDDGCGMDSEMLARLFEPFFTTKEVGKGTGLGLATVYGIVKQNHGAITVYSEPGRGTTFTIYLPRHAEKAAEAPPKEPAAEPAAHGHETILVVEDEPAILRLTSRMLRELGYTVLTAAAPGEAMRLAREHAGDIHLLITDVVMPEMNGRELAGNLLAIHPRMKRMFVSGYTADVIAHHGVLDPGVCFMQKPFALKEFAARIREVLARE